MRTREISLVDLLVEILLRWRSALVWMLIGALLMGGVSYVRSMRLVEAQKQALEQQKDTQTGKEYLENTLTEMQKNNVKVVLGYENFSKYYNQSLLMQLDPVNVPKTELIFGIASDDKANSYSLALVYEDLISCGFCQWIAQNNQGNINASGISELVSVNVADSDLYELSETINFLYVTVMHVTEEECRQLAQQVVDFVNEQNVQLNGSVEEHKITLVNQTFACGTDMELLNLQRSMMTNIMANNTNAEKLKADFTADEARYYELLKNPNSEEEQQTEEILTVSKPYISTKYILLGMVLSVFLYVFYVFMKYTMSTKLRATDDVKEIYNISQLGQIPQGTVKKKLFSFVDRFILSLRERNKRVFSVEEAIELTATAVKIIAKKEHLDKVYCLGCDMKAESIQLAEKIEAVLKANNIKMVILNNALYNHEMLEQLQGDGGAFLLEKAGETLCDEIVKEVELLQRQEIKLLGMVIIE